MMSIIHVIIQQNAFVFMMARQYKPFTITVKNIPLIIYPVNAEDLLQDIYEPLDRASITKHITTLYDKKEKVIVKGEYNILFIWNLAGQRMTDVWIHSLENWSDSGRLLECLTFRKLDTCNDAGIASGISNIVLEREEELRRHIENLSEYVDRTRYTPTFPEGMAPTENFHSLD